MVLETIILLCLCNVNSELDIQRPCIVIYSYNKTKEMH